MNDEFIQSSILDFIIQFFQHLKRADVHFRKGEPFLAKVLKGRAEVIDGASVNYYETIVGVPETL